MIDLDFLIPLGVLITFICLAKYVSSAGSRKVIALDTEMVGAGPRGSVNMVARVSIVNRSGMVVYDEYVAPTARVTDYRTPWSGIGEDHLFGAKDFHSVQQDVRNILKDCILVGHDLKFDLLGLNLSHPAKDIRDTALYKPFRQFQALRVHEKPSLKFLARILLGRYIQVAQHSSVEDARAAMDLYLMHEKQWEKELEKMRNQHNF